MTVTRQDAWTEEEDLQLAEAVLRHIRQGSTQLAAFEEIAEKLSRTSAACGFRWNASIRKKYDAEVALAKKKRTAKKRETTKASNVDRPEPESVLHAVETPKNEEDSSEGFTLEKVIGFLQEYKDQHVSQEQLISLQKENEALKEQLDRVKKEKNMMASDYKSLLEIMDRARQLTGEGGSSVGGSL
ncbi:RsfA family transcriptional regulator [Shouchella shacheensis]|uniref:RsfA family transcriptional regulator n=1 Tax=Shouchella shacheensis TaxID=1649580 RepID=UPI00073FD8A6|nr:RsfA family transcriptional regulator [Shouchella shacheensis]